MKYLFLSILTFGFSSVGFAYSCKIDQIKQNNPNFCEKRRETKSLSEAEMRNLFTEVQNSMTEFILQGRKPEDLSPEEKSIFGRISTVKFLKWENCGTSREGEPSVNATYSSTEHGVRFCDGLKDFPIAALVGMIGHEIGHSSDSCSSQCYHVQARDRNLLRLPSDYTRSTDADQSLIKDLRSSHEPISMTMRFVMNRPDIMEGWRNAGVAQLNEPMPLNRYPLNRIRRCLIDQDQVWIPPTSNGPEASDRIGESRDTAPGCNSHSDFESMADVWGAYALGKYFENHPDKKGDAALGLFESRKNEICSVKSYASTIARLESIWLAVPSVAQAVGCESVPERSCMSHVPFPAPLITGPSNPRLSSPGRGTAPGARTNGESQSRSGTR